MFDRLVVRPCDRAAQPSLFPKLFQSRFNGGFERRRIVLNRQPHANDVDSVVFVPREASYGAQLGPRNSGAQFLGHAAEFHCRFADPLQTALCRIARLEVFCESRQMGMCLTQVIALAAAWWGGPPGPRGTPSSRCRKRRQGPPRGRGAPSASGFTVAPDLAVKALV